MRGSLWAIGKHIEMIELQSDRGPFTLKKIRTAQSYLGWQLVSKASDFTEHM